MATDDSTWFKRRGYLHFDAPLGVAKATKLVRNTKAVSKHAFYPLLRYEVISKKLKRNADGKLKPEPKVRPISYAAHADSQIYSFYANQLAEAYERKLASLGISECVLAFRKLRKSNIEFARDAFSEISSMGRCSAVAIDISKFFDTINHQHLKRSWCDVIGRGKLPNDHYAVFKSLTKFSFCNRDAVYKTFQISSNNPWNGRQRICEPAEFRKRVRDSGLITTNKDIFGIPQGTPLSALLSNIYMIDFDRQMKALAKECGGSYRRYCDDMLFIVKRGCEARVESQADSELTKLGVVINPKKTEIRHFWRYGGVQTANAPLQYLGFTFDGQRILLRSAALAKFSGRMNKAIRLVSRALENQLDEGEDVRLRKKKLYERYSHLGHRNFIRYGLRAADKMHSKAIKRQLKPLWGKLNKKLDNLS
ncbi:MULTISPECIES: antiviral reverse transcriptase Drt2 [Idiomarina]|uniref:antiviral reverse transcriptase Drt2 n=1 Tax=Idiomarina TaxID=135575 RepID=UPI00129B2A6A|nr:MULTISPECIES: antiviral reverse transcriptase Drt2 [Idiomarina]MRJ41635.1 hypothetical protein [Idiomarina sp. FeN1]NCU57625.1 hypothetical protein [Idiomarina sp. FenA--70]NCU60177.1 hypothetical protein [Idiomarina sp. FenBw--71]UUN13474.1 group II intron reverse transcriptase domain-containing protein [Idiomarina loihiensis]